MGDPHQKSLFITTGQYSHTQPSYSYPKLNKGPRPLARLITELGKSSHQSKP